MRIVCNIGEAIKYSFDKIEPSTTIPLEFNMTIPEDVENLARINFSIELFVDNKEFKCIQKRIDSFQVSVEYYGQPTASHLLIVSHLTKNDSVERWSQYIGTTAVFNVSTNGFINYDLIASRFKGTSVVILENVSLDLLSFGLFCEKLPGKLLYVDAEDVQLAKNLYKSLIPSWLDCCVAVTKTKQQMLKDIKMSHFRYGFYSFKHTDNFFFFAPSRSDIEAEGRAVLGIVSSLFPLNRFAVVVKLEIERLGTISYSLGTITIVNFGRDTTIFTRKMKKITQTEQYLMTIPFTKRVSMLHFVDDKNVAETIIRQVVTDIYHYVNSSNDACLLGEDMPHLNILINYAKENNSFVVQKLMTTIILMVNKLNDCWKNPFGNFATKINNVVSILSKYEKIDDSYFFERDMKKFIDDSCVQNDLGFAMFISPELRDSIVCDNFNQLQRIERIITQNNAKKNAFIVSSANDYNYPPPKYECEYK